jgi:phosphoribosylaminoimidazolecarboxamide formyltransferase/IMP cyclohydrolase
MHHPIRRALLSVSDKTGIVEFARFLLAQGVELISTGGTAQLLREHEIRVRDVSDLTQFPEMMDGRVKTLHPLVHGGLLARRADDAHMQAAMAHHIQLIDLLVVNLYPFEATLNATTDIDTLIENIDIGGPAMIRAAAKNHEDVAVIVDPADYAGVMAAMEAGGNALPLERTRALAAKAFARTAAYDTLVSSWMAGVANAQPWPDYLLDAQCAGSLRYGENPHQQAALYRRVEARGGIASAQQLQGKELSYNNLADADAAWQIVSTLDAPTVAIIKHANPCGVATGEHATAAFARALASDPVSAFGGILAVNRPVEASLVEAIGSLFLEVIIAPEVTPQAQALLAAKKNLRVLVAQKETHASPLSGWMISAISGGYLVQQTDNAPAQAWSTATGTAPSDAVLSDAQLAFHVVKYVKSNAIVLVKNHATIGIGAGQQSRVDSVRIAIEKARQHGHDPHGAVLASDAFFPFADNVELAAQAGIATLVQPGGSVRDPEVIAAANAHGITMLMTGSRHFRH